MNLLALACIIWLHYVYVFYAPTTHYNTVETLFYFFYIFCSFAVPSFRCYMTELEATHDSTTLYILIHDVLPFPCK